jgi:signal transduction histidine kinase
MLLTDKVGPLEANQRRLLEEMEKSCGRLKTLINEMSELGQLMDGRQALAHQTSDLTAILREVSGAVPDSQDHGRVIIADGTEPLLVKGDGSRLRRVVESIIFALRRETIDGADLLVSAGSRTKNGGRVAWVTFGTAPVAAALREASADSLGPFDEWRGGCGLTLPLARVIIEMHGGRLLALTGERQKAGGVLELPLVR